MAASGVYVVKNPEKYRGDHTNVIYRSSWELHAFQWADTSSSVKSWSSEEIVVPYVFEGDNAWHRYFVDLKIEMSNGDVFLVEIKPHKETVKPKYPGKQTKRYLNEAMTFVKNQNKWKAAERYASKRGWKFVIWTENELTKMGIMPKMKKGLPRMKTKKTIKPYKAFSKKKK